MGKEVDFARIDFMRIDLVGVDLVRIDLVGVPPWKPETLSSSRPLLPSFQGQRLPSATNSNVKKKRSPSSKKRSVQRLKDFLAKKKGQGCPGIARHSK